MIIKLPVISSHYFLKRGEDPGEARNQGKREERDKVVEVERTCSFLLDRTALPNQKCSRGQTVSLVVTVGKECLLQAPGGRTMMMDGTPPAAVPGTWCTRCL